jgi:hypothetical protein
MSEFTFEAFQVACQECVARAPSCGGWALTFRSEDYEREWYVTAHAGTYAATLQVSSAGATASQVPDAIAEVGKMLEELRTGVIDASARRNAILKELGVRP